MLGWKGANSEEFAKGSSDPHVVVFMPEIDPTTMGGTMRLGQRKTLISSLPSGKQSIASMLHEGATGTYVGSTHGALPRGQPCSGVHEAHLRLTNIELTSCLITVFPTEIMERHRHRYEVNPEKVRCQRTKLFHKLGRMP